MNMMKAISLGWGTQSFGLAAMSALSVLPPVDVAIHADTAHERRETYEFAAKWTPWLEEHGVRVVTVRSELAPYQFRQNSGVFIPAYTTAPTRFEGLGQLRRSCTQRWKIAPMRRWLREQGATAVEQWIGISLDEVERRRLSDVQWVTNTYPFLDFDIRIERASRYGVSHSDIVRWLVDNDLEVPVKSSCVFCPFHNRATWREIQLAGNGDWEKAVQVDEAIRNKRPGYTCYLTPQRKPLVNCDFRSQEEHGQLSFLEAEECQGMCFL